MAGGTRRPIRKQWLSENISTAVTGSRVNRRRLEEWAHGSKNPQCLRIEGIAPALRDAMVVDRRVAGCHIAHGETLPGSSYVGRKPATSLIDTGVGVKVGVAAAHSAPIHELLIGRALFVEHRVQ